MAPHDAPNEHEAALEAEVGGATKLYRHPLSRRSTRHAPCVMRL
jgi:hypothetical protein